MSRSLTLYGSIMSFVWETEMRFNDLRNMFTFVWAIVGLLASGSIHLSIWSQYRNSWAKAASTERQFSRWLHNDKLYKNLASLALMDWSYRSVELALDTMVLWDNCAVVRVAVIYRGRSLPLAWVVLGQSSASVALSKYQHIPLHTGLHTIILHIVVGIMNSCIPNKFLVTSGASQRISESTIESWTKPS